MKKRNLAIIISIFIASLYLFPSAANANLQTSIRIEGKSIEFSEKTGRPFLDENSRTQVPFRIALESVGAEVDWNSVTQTASAKKGGITIEIPIGEKHILRNGVKIDNDTKAIVKDNRTFLPIRVVMEALGYKVGWDGQNNIVNIDTDLAPSETYLKSISGVWYLEKYNYFYEITNSGAFNGASRGSEYDMKGTIKSKEYIANTDSLKTLLNLSILEMGGEPENMNTTYVFNRIGKDKLRVTYPDGEIDELVYIAKDIPTAEQILDGKDLDANSPEEYFNSLVGIWYNANDNVSLEIDKDLEDIYLRPPLSFTDTAAMVRYISNKDNGSIDLGLGVRFNLDRWQDITERVWNLEKNSDGTLSVFDYFEKSITEYVYIAKDEEAANNIFKTKYNLQGIMKKK